MDVIVFYKAWDLRRVYHEESVSEHSNSDSPHAAALNKVKVSKILMEDF